MLYIYPLPIIIVCIILYLVTKQWELKIIAKIVKLLLFISAILFIVTYASHLGYNIPFITDFCNNIITKIVSIF